jgi:hypothetical protein
MEERIHRRQEPRTTADPALSSGDDESTDGEFEFPCFLGANHGSPALADDLFADGRIRPATFYPVFGRRSSVTHGLAPAPAPATERRTRGQLGRLFLEESRAWNSSSSSSTGSSASTSSSAATDDLEGAAPESYCVWAPGASAASSPRPRKSGSTGSLSRWRRVSQLVVGRSSSVGRDKFGFFSAPASPAREEQPKAKPAASPGRKKGTEVGTVAASHRMFYGAAKPSPGAPRRTFLPYRQDLFGIFSAPKGLSRSQFQYQPAI